MVRRRTGLSALLALCLVGAGRSAAEAPGRPRAVFFGSSTIEGVGAPAPERRWTSLLSEALGWTELNEGLGGSTLAAADAYPVPPRVATGVERWPAAFRARRADYAVIMYGANDVLASRGLAQDEAVATFARAAATLLAGIRREAPGAKIVVVASQPAPGLRARQGPFDAAWKRVAADHHAAFVDFEGAASDAYWDDLSLDGLHPNALGHAFIASWIAARLVDAGMAPRPPPSVGGHAPLAGDALAPWHLHVASGAPLSAGEVRHVLTELRTPGLAMVAVLRRQPAGFHTLYRSPVGRYAAGRVAVEVPRWRVRAGDLLAIWTDAALASGRGGTRHVVPLRFPELLRDLPPTALVPTVGAPALQAVADGPARP